MARPQSVRIRSAIWALWCGLHFECARETFRNPTHPWQAGKQLATAKRYMAAARAGPSERLLGREEQRCCKWKECSSRSVCLERKVAAVLNGDTEYNSATTIWDSACRIPDCERKVAAVLNGDTEYNSATTIWDSAGPGIPAAHG